MNVTEKIDHASERYLKEGETEDHTKEYPFVPEEAVSPEEKFKDEFSKRLDEIAEKFKGELTPEQKKEKALLQQKVATDAMKKVSDLWNALPRKQKRELTPVKNRYSAKLKKRLK